MGIEHVITVLSKISVTKEEKETKEMRGEDTQREKNKLYLLGRELIEEYEKAVKDPMINSMLNTVLGSTMAQMKEMAEKLEKEYKHTDETEPVMVVTEKKDKNR